jgi:hypothetical protein
VEWEFLIVYFEMEVCFFMVMCGLIFCYCVCVC